MSFSSYGTDWFLRDGDLVSTVNGRVLNTKDYEIQNADPSKFEGYFNVLKSLTNRLITPKGDNHFHPEYGSNLMQMLSQPNSPTLAKKLEKEVRDTCMEDGRVQSVESVVVKQSGRSVDISAKIKLIGQSDSFEFIFPRFLIE
jgi:phage baseplate assembly protein W